MRARRMIVRALAGERVWSSGWKVASTSTMSPGRSLPATPVSALMRIEISCWPFSSAGGSTSIPCCSSTPAGSGALGTSAPICDGSRSAWRPTHFSGTDFSASGVGRDRLQLGNGAREHEHGRLGLDVLAHVGRRSPRRG